jgi:hypothetical protein
VGGLRRWRRMTCVKVCLAVRPPSRDCWVLSPLVKLNVTAQFSEAAPCYMGRQEKSYEGLSLCCMKSLQEVFFFGRRGGVNVDSHSCPDKIRAMMSPPPSLPTLRALPHLSSACSGLHLPSSHTDAAVSLVSRCIPHLLLSTAVHPRGALFFPRSPPIPHLSCGPKRWFDSGPL